MCGGGSCEAPAEMESVVPYRLGRRAGSGGEDAVVTSEECGGESRPFSGKFSPPLAAVSSRFRDRECSQPASGTRGQHVSRAPVPSKLRFSRLSRHFAAPPDPRARLRSHISPSPSTASTCCNKLSRIEQPAARHRLTLLPMRDQMRIPKVEKDGDDGLIVIFSDGTTAGYGVEELLSLRPNREPADGPLEQRRHTTIMKRAFPIVVTPPI